MWFLWQPPNWNVHHTCPICCVPGYTGCYSVIPHKNKALLVQITVLRSGTCTAVSTVLMGVTPSELTVRFEHPHKYCVATQPILHTPTQSQYCLLHGYSALSTVQIKQPAVLMSQPCSIPSSSFDFCQNRGRRSDTFQHVFGITVYLGRQRRELTLWGPSFLLKVIFTL